MSALIPYTDFDEDLDADEEDEDLGAPKDPTERLSRIHTNLMRTIWNREAMQLRLAGRLFHAQAGDINGENMHEVFLILDDGKGLGEGPAWHANVRADCREVRLLSWTSKMDCPSFSLPAGSPAVGGSCLGATGGMTLVPTKQLVGARRAASKISGEAVVVDNTVCGRCYALAGHYQHTANQAEAVLRYEWVRAAVEDGSFVEWMTYAVESADYKLEGGRTKEKDISPERIDRRTRFFRIHDAGDFYSFAYLKAWNDVAKGLQEITFWAPTRIWATKAGLEWVARLKLAPNLILRPSSYEINAAPPALGGNCDAGSTTIVGGGPPEGNRGMRPELEEKVARAEGRRPERTDGGPDVRYDWDCRAYAKASEEHSCREAVAPDGKKGCRACWILPKERINYALKGTK